MRPLLRTLQASLLLAAGPALLSMAAAQPAPLPAPPPAPSAAPQAPASARPAAPPALPAPPPPPGGSGAAPAPPATYPPGAYPPGAYPPGAYPPGYYPPPGGSVPPAYYPPPGASGGPYPYPVYYPPPAGSQGAYPPGAYPPGAYPPGYYPPGAYPQGAYPPGAYPQGYYPPGYYPPGAYPPGAYPPGNYPPGSNYPPPAEPRPTEKPKPKGYKEHDGFFLTITPGFVLHHSTLSVEGSSAKATLGGLGTGLDVGLGYTVAEGLVLGGMIGQQSSTVSIHNENTDKDAGSTGTGYSFVALLVDYYTNPKKGFHLQGMIGQGNLQVDKLTVGPIVAGGVTQTVPIDQLTGVAGALGIGLETFVSDEWSLGGLLRLDMASLSGGSSPTKTTATVVTPSLRMSFTYH